MNSDVRSPSWGELVTRLRPFVRRRVSTEVDADDVMQEVLLRMHRGLATLRDETRLSAWMYRIARGTIVDHYRSRGRQPLSLDAEQWDGDLPGDTVINLDHGQREDSMAEESPLVQVLAASLRPMVDALPLTYREALRLTEIEGLSQKQAAQRLGLSLSGMKSRVQRGRVKLRTMLEDCCTIALDARGKVMSCEPRNASSGDPCVCCNDTED